MKYGFDAPNTDFFLPTGIRQGEDHSAPVVERWYPLEQVRRHQTIHQTAGAAGFTNKQRSEVDQGKRAVIGHHPNHLSLGW